MAANNTPSPAPQDAPKRKGVQVKASMLAFANGQACVLLATSKPRGIAACLVAVPSPKGTTFALVQAVAGSAPSVQPLSAAAATRFYHAAPRYVPQAIAASQGIGPAPSTTPKAMAPHDAVALCDWPQA